MYRLKYRISFILDNFRIDLTCIKIANSLNLIKSDLFNKPENYEIEIELLDNIKTLDTSTIIINTQQHIIKILQILNNGLYLISNNVKNTVLYNYKHCINMNKYLEVKPVAFTYNKLKTLSKEDFENNNYYVTEKADGVTALLYVNTDNKVYIITRNLDKVIYTGYSCNYINTIIDGEYISEYNKNDILLDTEEKPHSKEYIFKYLAFDIYYYEGEEVYKSSFRDRLELLNSLEFKSELDLLIDFNIKEYYLPNEGIPKIIEKDTNREFSYNIDGFIFQPNDAYTKLNTTNEKVLKWKPQKFNTIDFLIKIIKVDKKLVAKFLSANKNYNKTIYSDFEPIAPYILNANIQHYDTDIIYSLDGNIVESDTIVECSYNVENKQWNILRTRYDKSLLLKKNIIRGTANNIYVANDIWSNIFNPVKLDEIDSTEKILAKFDIESKEYYTFNNKKRYNYQNKHNEIKTLLINNCINTLALKFQDIKVLDLACGRGGDLHKLILTNHVNNKNNNKLKTGVSYILGIDYSKNNLEHFSVENQSNAGARARIISEYSNYKDSKIIPNIIKNKNIYYVSGDLSSHVLDKKGLMITDEYEKEVFNYIWDEHKLGNKFQFINLQFALHYFFKTEETLHTILKTISNNLVDNGLCCLTTMDDNIVKNLLLNSENQEYNTELFRIKSIDNINVSKKIGHKISVYIDSIGIEEEEYLVNFEHFINIASHYNLFISKINYLNVDLNKKGYFKDIELNTNYKLDSNEDTFSSLYRYIILQKNSKQIKLDTLSSSD